MSGGGEKIVLVGLESDSWFQPVSSLVVLEQQTVILSRDGEQQLSSSRLVADLPFLGNFRPAEIDESLKF